MSDGGIVTAEVNGFQVTTNSGVSEAQLKANLKPKADESASRAGSELGKRGAEAKAAKVKEEPEDKPDAERSEAKSVRDDSPEEAEKPQPEAKAGDEDKGEEKPPEKDKVGNPRHDPKARMLEATRKEAEAKRALAAEREAKAALEARLAALEASRTAPAQEAKPKADPDAKPAPDAFETYEEYLDARDTWNRKQWETELKARSEAESFNRAMSEQIGKFQKAAAQHLDRYSEEVVSLQTEFQLPPGTQPNGSNWVANELFASPESAPTLMLHFTEHPEELQRIAALSNPRAVSREMAKLETRLESVTTGNSTRRDDDVSRAAPPVKPVTGKPYVTESDGYREGMSLDDYARVWNKQKRLR